MSTVVQKANHAEKPHPSKLLLTLDLMGTFVFALEGAMAAVDGDLDLLGLMVLSFCTALGGGIIRDLRGRGGDGSCGAHEGSKDSGRSVRSDGVFRATDYQFVAALEFASCAGALSGYGFGFQQ